MFYYRIDNQAGKGMWQDNIYSSRLLARVWATSPRRIKMHHLMILASEWFLYGQQSNLSEINFKETVVVEIQTPSKFHTCWFLVCFK